MFYLIKATSKFWAILANRSYVMAVLIDRIWKCTELLPQLAQAVMIPATHIFYISERRFHTVFRTGQNRSLFAGWRYWSVPTKPNTDHLASYCLISHHSGRKGKIMIWLSTGNGNKQLSSMSKSPGSGLLQHRNRRLLGDRWRSGWVSAKMA